MSHRLLAPHGRPGRANSFAWSLPRSLRRWVSSVIPAHTSRRSRVGPSRYAPPPCPARTLAPGSRESCPGAVVSLNALNRCRAGRRLITVPACRGFRPGFDADVLDSVFNNLGRAVGEFLPKPAEHAVCAGGAHRELLKSRDIYDFSLGAHIARYDPNCSRFFVARTSRWMLASWWMVMPLNTCDGLRTSFCLETTTCNVSVIPSCLAGARSSPRRNSAREI